MEYKLIIDGILPNLNDYINQLNIGKFVGAEFKRKTEREIKKYITKQLRGVRITKPVKVLFHWFEPNKKRDKDNIAAAKKFIFDALVATSVLRNDGWFCVDGFTDKFGVDQIRPRIEVTMIERSDEINKVILMGRFTRDLEVKYSQSSNPIAILKNCIAVSRAAKKDEADFINVTAFGKTAEAIGKYFKKGSLIAVSGKIQTGSYEKNGVKIPTVEVIVDNFYFTGEKKDGANAQDTSPNESYFSEISDILPDDLSIF